MFNKFGLSDSLLNAVKSVASSNTPVRKYAAFNRIEEDKRQLSNQPSVAETNEAMDPVGREDKDIDNDGDTDKSDSYLHKRRKAIRTALSKGKKDKIDLNPKEVKDKGDM